MEFLLQLMAELFTSEPNADEVANVAANQQNEVFEVARKEQVSAHHIQDEVLVEEPNLFNVVEFH
jgi:hypothetical protein